MIDRGKESKTLNEIKLVENVNESLRSFLEIRYMQKEVLTSLKLQGHEHE